ncbi:hypothetical protein ScPMuIL_016654 [Solemya velum]
MSIFNLGQRFDTLSSKEMDLLEAAKSGNTKEAERILSSRTRKGSGGALSAITRSFTRAVNVNCTDKCGATPLHLTALHGHEDTLILLLQNEAIANITDSRGCTPLHLAAWSGNAEICNILLSMAAVPPHINTQNNDGDTALHCAAQYGLSSAVVILLQNNADASISNLKGETPLDLAAQYGRIEALKELIKHSQVICRPVMNQSPLHLAARNGHHKVCEALLDAGFNINVMTSIGTALHEAALYCKLDVVRLLLDKDISISEKNEQKKTALDLVIGHPPQKTSYAKVAEMISEHIKKKAEQKAGPVLRPHPPENLKTDSTMYSKVNKIKGVPEITHSHDSTDSSFDETPPPLPPRTASLFQKEKPPDPVAPPIPPPPMSVGGGDGYLSMDAVVQPKHCSPAKPPRKKPKPPTEKPPEDCIQMEAMDNKPTTVDNNLILHKERSSKNSGQRGDNSSVVCDISDSIKLDDLKQDSAVINHAENVNSDNAMQKPPVSIEHSQQPVEGDQRNHPINENPAIEPSDSNSVIPRDILRSSSSDCNSAQSMSEISVSIANSVMKGDKSTQSSVIKNSPAIPERPKSENPVSAKLEAGVSTNIMTTSFDSAMGFSKPNSLDLDNQRMSRSSCEVPLSPTGYTQPPTPDFPPPSPDTAIFGIQQKIGAIDKRHSKDMETITEMSFLRIQPVIQANPERTDAPPDVDTYQAVSNRQDQSTLSVHETIEEQPEVSENSSPDNEKSKETSSVNTKGIENPEETPPEQRLGENEISVLNDDKNALKGNSIEAEIIQPVSNGKKHKTDIELAPEPIEETKTETKEETKEEIKVDSEVQLDEKKDDSIKNYSEEMVSTGLKLSDGPETTNVVMRNKSKSTSSEEEGETTLRDPDLKIYADLLKGSAPGGPRKVVSQIYENVVFKTRISPSNRQSVPVSVVTFDPLTEEDDIDTAKIMEAIESVSTSKPTTYTAPPPESHVDGSQDDNEQWKEIADVVASYGGRLSLYGDYASFEAHVEKLLSTTGIHKIQSVEDWLEGLGLSHYENTLVANGFDDTDFLGIKIMDDQDLDVIGISVPEHRKKMIESAKSLKQIKPIDQDNPPESVEQWLSSLHLSDYLSTFVSNKYDTIDRVCNLWEHELTTVLDISSLGHRKRILASLGERKTPERTPFPSMKRKKEVKEVDEIPARFSGINLYKDYTNVKPISSSEEDVKQPSPSLPQFDSSEDEEVFHREGRKIRDSSIHLRPPYLAHTCSPVKTWRHRPENLIKGCCNYSAQYLGSTLVSEPLTGSESTQGGISKLKKSAEVVAKIPLIILSISYKGVKFIDAKSKKVICDHEIGNIFCACQDGETLNFFAYITQDVPTARHYCHVFNVKNPEHAREIILTLGQAFEIAYQMVLKKKAEVDALDFEQKLGQPVSDKEECNSVSSHASSSTV